MQSTTLFLTFFLSTLAVIVSSFLLLERWFKHRERAWMFVIKQDNNKAITSLRISALERLTLMLERISPTSLVMRQNVATSSAAMLQLELVKSIREEFDHNVSLQIYVSNDCWDKVKQAKEETTQLIKIAYTKVRPESTGMDLSREIFKLEAATGNNAIRIALEAVKYEALRNY